MACFKEVRNICAKIVENNYFVFFSIIMVIINFFIITAEVSDEENVDNLYEFIISSDKVFNIYFIFEAIISVIASTGSWKSFNGFWTYFDFVVIFVNSMYLIGDGFNLGIPNFSAIRLWSIFKYLPRIKCTFYYYFIFYLFIYFYIILFLFYFYFIFILFLFYFYFIFILFLFYFYFYFILFTLFYFIIIIFYFEFYSK